MKKESNFVSDADLEKETRVDFLNLHRKQFNERERFWTNRTVNVEKRQTTIEQIKADFKEAFKISISALIKLHLDHVSKFIYHRIMIKPEVEVAIVDDRQKLEIVHVHKSYFDLLLLRAGENYSLMALIDFYYYCTATGQSPKQVDSYNSYLNYDGVRVWRNEII